MPAKAATGLAGIAGDDSLDAADKGPTPNSPPDQPGKRSGKAADLLSRILLTARIAMSPWMLI